MSTENQQTEAIRAMEEAKLEITKEIETNLDETGKWGKFLAILAFVGIGIVILMGFVMSFMLAFVPMAGENVMPFPPFLFGLLYLILGGVYFIPVLYLYRFASGVRQAIHSSDQKQLLVAFRNLKAHYRFIGIFTIVMFGLYVVMFVVMLFVGLFSGLSSGLSGFPA